MIDSEVIFVDLSNGKPLILVKDENKRVSEYEEVAVEKKSIQVDSVKQNVYLENNNTANAKTETIGSSELLEVTEKRDKHCDTLYHAFHKDVDGKNTCDTVLGCKEAESCILAVDPSFRCNLTSKTQTCDEYDQSPMKISQIT